MLETIREYAAAKLDSSGLRPDLEQRHAVFFHALAEFAEPHLRGNPGAWIARLENEHDNLRTAIDRLVARGDDEREVHPDGDSVAVLVPGGPPSEGRRRLEHAVAAHPAGTDPARAKALVGGWGTGSWQEDITSQPGGFDWRPWPSSGAGDPAGIAQCPSTRPSSRCPGGDFDGALGCPDESWELVLGAAAGTTAGVVWS